MDSDHAIVIADLEPSTIDAEAAMGRKLTLRADGTNPVGQASSSSSSAESTGVSGAMVSSG